MKKILIFLLLIVIFISCCIQNSCEQFCEKQPHIMCTGSWNISGAYPDCSCGWICEEEIV